MALSKHVNGKPVPMTPEEEQKFLDQQTIDSTPLTDQELDALADAIADQVMLQSKNIDRALGLTLAEVVWRVSQGTVPVGITEAQARTWVRDTFRDHYRSLL